MILFSLTNLWSLPVFLASCSMCFKWDMVRNGCVKWYQAFQCHIITRCSSVSCLWLHTHFYFCHPVFFLCESCHGPKWPHAVNCHLFWFDHAEVRVNMSVMLWGHSPSWGHRDRVHVPSTLSRWDGMELQSIMSLQLSSKSDIVSCTVFYL